MRAVLLDLLSNPDTLLNLVGGIPYTQPPLFFLGEHSWGFVGSEDTVVEVQIPSETLEDIFTALTGIPQCTVRWLLESGSGVDIPITNPSPTTPQRIHTESVRRWYVSQCPPVEVVEDMGKWKCGDSLWYYECITLSPCRSSTVTLNYDSDSLREVLGVAVVTPIRTT